MPENVTFPIGNVALIDKIDFETGFFKTVFESVMGKARTFISSVKLLMNNKLGQSVSINWILDFTPVEFQEIIGFNDDISERTLYRNLERCGERPQFILELYQQWTQTQKLVDPTQFVYFSSKYFEGTKCQLGKPGYSREHQPGKLQITFGISVGLNNIPIMLKIEAVAQFEKINPMVEFVKNMAYSEEFSTVFNPIISTIVELKRSMQHPQYRKGNTGSRIPRKSLPKSNGCSK